MDRMRNDTAEAWQCSQRMMRPTTSFDVSENRNESNVHLSTIVTVNLSDRQQH